MQRAEAGDAVFVVLRRCLEQPFATCAMRCSMRSRCSGVPKFFSPRSATCVEVNGLCSVGGRCDCGFQCSRSRCHWRRYSATAAVVSSGFQPPFASAQSA
jgi:hypothetical protein